MKLPRILRAIALGLVSSLTISAAAPSAREQLSLNSGWRFHPGDIPFPEVKGHGPTYNNAKAGRAGGAAAPEYDDTAWRQLDLPHDWAVEGPFDKNANLSQGFRPRGFAWYRRHFQLSPDDRGRHLELQFDGVSTHATVWVNGTVVHRNWCGYTSFYIDITPFAKYGDELNTIAIRVDAEQQEGWWYEGGGIYRHTWLVKRSPVHIVTDGVYANPIRNADGSWAIPVEVTLNNAGKVDATVQIESVLTDAAGQVVAQGRTQGTVKPLETTAATFAIAVPSPRLWSVDAPVLYNVRTTVKRDGAAVDELVTTCGFRTLRFDADKGFFLNDQPLKLKGTCNHQDHAGVGVAVPDSIWDFRVRKLKEMGSNAYRCAHNPPAKEFLDACDRLGMLVMDENRLFNPSPEYMRQLEWLVRRDRNHPSVFLWSVFNEEPMQGTEQGYEMVRRMAALVKKLDATRPVTAAMNGGLFTPLNVSKAVDVVGFNYQIGAYDRFHQEHPTLPLTSSEDASALMQRGEYVTDKNANLVGSYDDQKPSWGATHRVSWRAIAERPYLAGGFAWTGFDYRGEPTPYEWPSAGSFFGIMDQCGFPKAAFYLRQAFWIENRGILQLVPHWNWPGREGQPIKVMALTNADTVELSLNGQPLETKSVDKYDMVSWEIPYTPGRLEAVGKKNGLEVSRFIVETTGEPVALQLIPDRTALAGDGRDALPVTVQALDAQGRPVPTANLPVDFELTGPGAIIGLANGDPNSHEAEKGSRRSLYHSLAQVILQSRAGGSGPLVLRARAGNLKTGETTLTVKAVAQLPAVPVAHPTVALNRWRMSPVTSTKPDANQEIADSDQNSWVNVQAGTPQTFAEGSWAIYRITFKPFVGQRKAGGQIRFKEITGQAEVYVDKKLAGTKATAEKGALVVPFGPGEGDRTLSILVQAEPGAKAGLTGRVAVESVQP
jgi:beta-galactosidase